MEKINIAELLKDCPSGMELDCTLFDDVKFETVANNSICIRLNNGESFTLSPYGNCIGLAISKCVIFPKGKTTWEGFVPPCKFKDGDVIVSTSGGIHIMKNSSTSYCYFDRLGILDKTETSCVRVERLANEEEIERLFKAIKDNGYKWNDEAKTLEKLVEPKFKVGDKVKSIFNNYQYIITELTDTHYTLVEVIDKFQYTEPIIEDKNWELVPDKFDITTLKPFDKVLTRANDNDAWVCNLYSHRMKDYYVVLNAELAKQCVPYEGNEHLLDTSNDCDDFYKTW